MFYLNSQKIPELAGLNFAQRMDVIRKSTDSLTVPVKLMLNIIKLLVLVPCFLLIAKASGLAILGYVVLLVIVYPLITRPITFALCRKYIPEARQKLYPN